MSKEEKKLGKSGLCRSKGHLHRGEVLRHSEGRLAVTKPKAKMATPRVFCSVAMLRLSEAVLRRSEDTIHRGKFLDFESEHLVFVHRSFGDPNK